jgi:hypothetical protein
MTSFSLAHLTVLTGSLTGRTDYPVSDPIYYPLVCVVPRLAQ